MFEHGLRVMRVMLVMLSALVSGEAFAEAWKHGKVRVCAEVAGWPPFSIPPKSSEGIFWGFNANMLAAILGEHGIPFEVDIRPWKRCLVDGMNGDIHIVLDAAKNAERERDYLLTEPIYELTPAFIFPAQKVSQYPEPVHAQMLQETKVCGQNGYTYSNFGIDDERVEQPSPDLSKILELVDLGRCDIGLARLEVLQAELKALARPDRFAYQRLQNATSEHFYWLLNRHAPFAEELKSLIDTEVARLKTTGESGKMLKAYLD